MAASLTLSCSWKMVDASLAFVGVKRRWGMLNQNQHGKINFKRSFMVCGATEGSEESSSSVVPSWAQPESDEPPPWAREEGKANSANQTNIRLPFFVYLLASAITAIAAIGSVFEYANQNPVFGILNSDSIFYAPLLGFFVFTGIPTSAFLWFKSVRVANEEADEQDRRDGCGVIANPYKAAAASAVSFLFGSCLPLVPALLITQNTFTRIAAIVVVASSALALLGAFRAYLGSRVHIPALRVLIGGWIAMAVTFACLPQAFSNSHYMT